MYLSGRFCRPNMYWVIAGFGLDRRFRVQTAMGFLGRRRVHPMSALMVPVPDTCRMTSLAAGSTAGHLRSATRLAIVAAFQWSLVCFALCYGNQLRTNSLTSCPSRCLDTQFPSQQTPSKETFRKEPPRAISPRPVPQQNMSASAQQNGASANGFLKNGDSVPGALAGRGTTGN